MKVVKIAVATVIGSVEDEPTSNTPNFIKNKNSGPALPTHLLMVVGMHAVKFCGGEEFLYDATYDSLHGSIEVHGTDTREAASLYVDDEYCPDSMSSEATISTISTTFYGLQ